MREVEDLIQIKIKELSSQGKFSGKQIFLFGQNLYTELINNLLYMEGYELCSILDNDKKKQGRRICNIPIVSPNDLVFEKSSIVLIASKHKKSMMAQLCEVSGDVEVIVLIDLTEYIDEVERRENEFWNDKNYELEIQKLYQGEAIYNQLVEEDYLIIFPGFSIGDMFLMSLFLHEYIKGEIGNIKIVSMSRVVHEVGRYFLGIENTETISAREMGLLMKYILWCRRPKVIVCDFLSMFYRMAIYKNIPTKCIASYIFGLDGSYTMRFPSIWDKALTSIILEKKGLLKGKSAILAPYANTARLLPCQFWTLLTERLIKMGYRVFTNIVGSQKPVKGSKGLVIPLNQIGSYLEFAGLFIALRSGLCDVAGHSQCKQIIFFRDEMVFQRTQIECFDLHVENISENAIQYVYNDGDLFVNIERVIAALSDE